VSTFARRVLIVEDEPLFASLVFEMLERAGFVVSITDNVATARSLITSWDPDLVLLDVALGAGPPGTQLAYYIGKKHPGIAILFLTRHPDVATAGIDTALVPAESGFLRKDHVADSNYLLDAIDKVLTNKADQVRHSFADGSPLAVLTPTQLAVLKMVAQGLNNQAIARRRNITVRSVEKNLHSIFSALELSGDEDHNLRVKAALTYVIHAGPPAPDETTRP